MNGNIVGDIITNSCHVEVRRNFHFICRLLEALIYSEGIQQPCPCQFQGQKDASASVCDTQLTKQKHLHKYPEGQSASVTGSAEGICIGDASERENRR